MDSCEELEGSGRPGPVKPGSHGNFGGVGAAQTYQKNT